MQFLVFALTYPLIWVMSKLPMRILYLKSDFFFFLIYHVFRYRRKVVLDNLKLAFPEKSDEERYAISKKFFKHFTDLIIETIKGFSISEKQILKRYTYKNPELVNNFAKQGKSIALVSPHQANWEWSSNLPLVLLDCNLNATYASLGNKYFDNIVKKTREKFGGTCYASSKTVKAIHTDYINKKQGLYFLISDQSPQLEHTVYWKTFFGINVPVHIGAEIIAKKFNLVVIYADTKKVKRGFYETEFKLITDSPKELKNYKITNEYFNLTEKTVKEQPEFYLWSHKRFKHKDKFDDWEKLFAAKKSKL